MVKSKRNKTITTTIEEGELYLDRCIEITENQEDLLKILNKTILGNTFNILPLLPKNSIDLIIVDPPYNITKSYSGNKFNKKSEEEYIDYTHSWIKLVKPLLKETGSIYVCIDWNSGIIVGNILKEYFTIQNRITWQREKGRGSKNNWKNGLEDIYFCTNSNNYTFNLDDVKIRKKVIAPYKENNKPKDWEETKEGNFRNTCPSNFWDDITIPFWSMSENTEHPTQKSEKLLAKIILASSNENDIILDPFVGSGTTSVTAKKLNRNYIGIEQEKQYCIFTEQRLEMANKDKSIQGYIDGIFYERNILNNK